MLFVTLSPMERLFKAMDAVGERLQNGFERASENSIVRRTAGFIVPTVLFASVCAGLGKDVESKPQLVVSEPVKTIKVTKNTNNVTENAKTTSYEMAMK